MSMDLQADRERIESRLRTNRRLLARLARIEVVSVGDVQAAYRHIAELAAELLQVERVSIWRRVDAGSERLECVEELQRSSATHSCERVAAVDDVSAYLQALTEQRCSVVEDARHNGRSPGVLAPSIADRGRAWIDAPIWVAGRIVGVVCHDHFGDKRRWTFVEELLAGTVADVIARVIEAGARLEAEQVSAVYRGHTQELQQLRSNDLQRLNAALEHKTRQWDDPEASHRELEEIRDMIDASPVPLVVTRIEDGVVRYVNHRASELFEVPGVDMIGRRAPDFYVDRREREEFLDRVRTDRRIDGFVAKLQTARGRTFWALMSAQCLRYQGGDCLIVGFSDITAQKVAEMAMRQSEENVRVLFEAAPVPLLLSSIGDQTVLAANRRAADLFEVRPEDVVGKKAPEFYVNTEDREDLAHRLVRDGEADGLLVRMRTAHGREFWGMLSARVLDFHGEPCFLIGIGDVTEQKALEEQLRHLATRDPLTGVYNRRHFMELAGLEVSRALRLEAPVTVCMLDADHFKRINDAMGHPVGDRVLETLARTCRSQLRVNDVLARLGGEEFAVLFPDTDMSGAMVVAERIRVAVEALRVDARAGRVVRPTVSIGVAQQRPGETLESLLRRADEALYRAKQHGRNRVVN